MVVKDNDLYLYLGDQISCRHNYLLQAKATVPLQQRSYARPHPPRGPLPARHLEPFVAPTPYPVVFQIRLRGCLGPSLARQFYGPRPWTHSQKMRNRVGLRLHRRHLGEECAQESHLGIIVDSWLLLQRFQALFSHLGAQTSQERAASCSFDQVFAPVQAQVAPSQPSRCVKRPRGSRL